MQRVADEEKVLCEVLDTIRKIRWGRITIFVADGRVERIERTEIKKPKELKAETLPETIDKTSRTGID